MELIQQLSELKSSYMAAMEAAKREELAKESALHEVAALHVQFDVLKRRYHDLQKQKAEEIGLLELKAKACQEELMALAQERDEWQKRHGEVEDKFREIAADCDLAQQQLAKQEKENAGLKEELEQTKRAHVAERTTFLESMEMLKELQEQKSGYDEALAVLKGDYEAALAASEMAFAERDESRASCRLLEARCLQQEETLNELLPLADRYRELEACWHQLSAFFPSQQNMIRLEGMAAGDRDERSSFLGPAFRQGERAAKENGQKELPSKVELGYSNLVDLSRPMVK